MPPTPLAHLYIQVKKSTALGRAYGIKVTCHWKHLWEHIQYFTSCFENFWGTHWEHQSPQTIQTLLTPSPKNLNTLGLFSALLHCLICLGKISITTFVCHYFRSRLMAGILQLRRNKSILYQQI